MSGNLETIGTARAPAAHAGPSAMREYLTFRLGAEEYALEILKVQEIRNYEAATAIANAPAFIKGVINLRGDIVPIADLRVLLGRPSAEYNAFTVVIVLNLERATVGIVVDAVSDVVGLQAGQIRPAPDFSGSVSTRYVTGLGTLGNRMLIVADIERLLAGEGALPSTATH